MSQPSTIVHQVRQCAQDGDILYRHIWNQPLPLGSSFFRHLKPSHVGDHSL